MKVSFDSIIDSSPFIFINEKLPTFPVDNYKKRKDI